MNYPTNVIPPLVFASKLWERRIKKIWEKAAKDCDIELVGDVVFCRNPDCPICNGKPAA